MVSLFLYLSKAFDTVSHQILLCITMLQDWLKKQAPPFHPIRGKNQNQTLPIGLRFPASRVIGLPVPLILAKVITYVFMTQD